MAKKHGFRLSKKNLPPQEEDTSDVYDKIEGALTNQETPPQDELVTPTLNQEPNTLSTLPDDTEKPKYEKGSRLTKAFRQAKSSILGSRVGSPAEELIRKELIPFTSKANLTKKFIEQNLAVLKDVAKSNQSVAEILKHIQDPKYQKSIDNIISKLTKNEEVFPEELKEMISYFENVAGGLEKIGVKLTYTLPDLIKSVQEVVSNNDIDLKDRRESLNTLIKIFHEQKVQNGTVTSLENIASNQLNFSEAQVNEIQTLSKELLKDDEVKNKKLYGTFSELNKKVGSVLLNIKEWKDFSEKKDETDRTVKESLLDKGLGAIGKGVKQGILDTVFAALGLPGLGTLLSSLGLDPLALVSGAGKGIGTAVTGVGKLVGIGGEGAGAEFGKLFKGFSSLSKTLEPLVDGFTEIVAPLAVLSSAIYGAVKGIMGTLDEWKNFFSGIADFSKSLYNYFGRLIDQVDGFIKDFSQVHPILGKMLEVIENTVSALWKVTKFILDLPVLLIKTIAQGFQNIFGFLGLGAGKIGDLLKGFSKDLDQALPQGTATAVNTQVSTLSNTTAPSLKEAASAQNTVNTLTGNVPNVNIGTDTKLNTPIVGKSTPSPVELNPQGKNLATSQYTEDRSTQQRIAEGATSPIVVQSPAPAERQPDSSIRKNVIDDLSLALTNSGLLYD